MSFEDDDLLVQKAQNSVSDDQVETDLILG